jgi:hypothetical protein
MNKMVRKMYGHPDEQGARSSRGRMKKQNNPDEVGIGLLE